ncbi:MAG TPA: hypothetical protein DFS52_30685 [Myxococcales bacterium]|jgi:hypothetical protein|nr:hypothetical protein [Myxococcales bacterium]
MAGPSKNDNVRSVLPPDQEAVAREATELDGEIAAMRARFDQYFLGVDKQNPIKDCEALKKRILKLKGQFIRNTGLKFRVQSLHAKFQSYERLWMKTLKEIEEGTYRRDLFRLRRKNQKPTDKPKPVAEAPEEKKEKEKPRPDFYSLDEDLEADLPDDLFEDFVPAKKPPKPAAAPPQVAKSPAAAPPSPPPVPKAPPAPRAAALSPSPPAFAPAPMPRTPTGPPPAPRAMPPPPPSQAVASKPLARTTTGSVPISVTPSTRTPPAPPKGAGTGDAGLSSEKINQLYNAYVTAKKRCKESTAGITPEAVAQSLRKQVPTIMRESGAKAVDFKVVIKDGKAILKAVPK